LYGHEILSLTLKDEHGWRMFQNRVLRRIFGQKRNEIIGDWGKFNDEWLHNLYLLQNIIRFIGPKGMRSMGYVACMGDK
jgi:hypothetical protein